MKNLPGEIKLPYTALLSAAFRVFYSTLGIGINYDGDILGETQWMWLKSVLEESTSDFHIIISSIQVLTTNPAVESWGHFPQAKKRLMHLFEITNPKGLVILSGDVHHAEISSSVVLDSNNNHNNHNQQLYEITSSGLTHTCGDSFLNYFLCPLMIQIFDQHRYDKKSYFIGKNFGLINLITSNNSKNEKTLALNISVVSLDSRTAVLSSVVVAEVLGMGEGDGGPHLRYSNFTTLSHETSSDVLAGVVLIVGFALVLAFAACAAAVRRLGSRLRSRGRRHKLD